MPASASLQGASQPTGTPREAVGAAPVLTAQYGVRRRAVLPQGKVKSRPAARVPVGNRRILIR